MMLAQTSQSTTHRQPMTPGQLSLLEQLSKGKQVFVRPLSGPIHDPQAIGSERYILTVLAYEMPHLLVSCRIQAIKQAAQNHFFLEIPDDSRLGTSIGVAGQFLGTDVRYESQAGGWFLLDTESILKEERRQFFRISTQKWVFIKQQGIETLMPCLMVDMGGGGCRIFSPVPLSMHHTATLNMNSSQEEGLPRDTIEFHIRGCTQASSEQKRYVQSLLNRFSLGGISSGIDRYERDLRRSLENATWYMVRCRFVAFGNKTDQDLIFKYCFQEQLRRIKNQG
ncbi:MAG: hypothetical protein ACKO37_06005 [Vampirovibrionales bacterium]